MLLIGIDILHYSRKDSKPVAFLDFRYIEHVLVCSDIQKKQISRKRKGNLYKTVIYTVKT